MTREEAIKEINKEFEPAFANYIITALTEGATKSDRCEDAVSRKAILEYQQSLHGKMPNKENYKLWEFITDLPSVTPKQQWIPASERLPDAQKDGDKDFSDWVQVTINLGKDNSPCVNEAYYCFSTNKWYTERFVIGEVIAWMPIPKPYEVKIDKTKTEIEDEIER